MRIVPDLDAIRYILQHPDSYVCYLGAGSSAEAGVKTAFQICDQIRDAVKPPNLRGKAETQWLNSQLRWDDLALRYAICIQKYGNQASRLQYFRQLLLGRRPSFCHHAVAMLATEGLLKKTILTTNFDKLVESAFTQQGRIECQAIRTKHELDYWAQEKDKAYVLKLHGDYDTYNIANTLDQIFMIGDKMHDSLSVALKGAGMIVVGAAGHEKSVHTLLDRLSQRTGPPDHVLDFGLLWGVYMGPNRPAKLNKSDVLSTIQRTIGRDIIQLMERMESRNEMFGFFPVWGAGNFFLDLIRHTKNRTLIAAAHSYMDHEMRLRQVFIDAKLKPKAVEQHLQKLRKQRERLNSISAASSQAETVYVAGRKRSSSKVRIIYGDITSRTLMSQTEFNRSRRAVVSPEDTCISAGGGVAYQLLRKAGEYIILNELAKLQPIDQGSVATTSAGNLPVHYIFHAAALKINQDATYSVSNEEVTSVVNGVLRLSRALDVREIWISLIGAGVAGLAAEASLRSILECARDWRTEYPSALNIVIYGDSVLPRTLAERITRQVLGHSFSQNVLH
jgi:O-acetyl-ADP-ribose deacetylase (regulator of RNase III)